MDKNILLSLTKSLAKIDKITQKNFSFLSNEDRLMFNNIKG